MIFEEFQSQSRKPIGFASQKWSEFPLLFDSQDALLEEIDEFSVIDDFLSDMDMDEFSGEFADKFPDYVVIAICDVETAEEESDDFVFDSHAEFFLCVDTSSNKNSVLIWTGEGAFEKLAPNFEAFHDGLRAWDPAEMD